MGMAKEKERRGQENRGRDSRKEIGESRGQDLGISAPQSERSCYACDLR